MQIPYHLHPALSYSLDCALLWCACCKVKPENLSPMDKEHKEMSELEMRKKRALGGRGAPHRYTSPHRDHSGVQARG